MLIDHVGTGSHLGLDQLRQDLCFRLRDSSRRQVKSYGNEQNLVIIILVYNWSIA